MQLKEQIQEVFKANDLVNVNAEESFEGLVRFDKFVHGGKVERILLHQVILLRQNFPIPTQNVRCVLLQQGNEAQVELAMSANCVRIVTHRLH